MGTEEREGGRRNQWGKRRVRKRKKKRSGKEGENRGGKEGGKHRTE
jgi:hypothetical protein